jgi:hypothetical protein
MLRPCGVAVLAVMYSNESQQRGMTMAGLRLLSGRALLLSSHDHEHMCW